MAEQNAGPNEQNAGSNGLNDMTRGRPWRHILLFTLPLLAGNVLQQLYNMVDAIVLGQFVGETAMGSVKTTAPVIFVITAMFVGIGLGAAVMLSQYFGTGDLESLRRLVATVYSLLLPIAGVLLLIIPLVGPLLRLIDAPVENFEGARLYMIIIVFGFLGSFGFNLNAGILQAMGNSVLPFKLLCISTAANIALDILFVAGFGWNEAGAAIATVIAQYGSWLGGIIYINKRYPFLKISLVRFEIHKEPLKKAIRLGLPSGVNQTLFQIGVLFIQGLVNKQGTEFLAGYSAAAYIDSFAVLPIQSVATGVTTFVAQNMGVGRIDRAKQGLKAGLAMSCGFSLLVAAVVLPLGRFLLKLFNVQAGMDTGLAYLWYVLPFYAVFAAMLMFHALLRGTGQMMVPMAATLASLLLVRVPVANLLTARFGAETMYFSFAIDWAVGLLVAGAYYFTGRWRRKRLVDVTEAVMLS